jgi:hypothetical protein
MTSKELKQQLHDIRVSAMASCHQLLEGIISKSSLANFDGATRSNLFNAKRVRFGTFGMAGNPFVTIVDSNDGEPRSLELKEIVYDPDSKSMEFIFLYAMSHDWYGVLDETEVDEQCLVKVLTFVENLFDYVTLEPGGLNYLTESVTGEY